MKENHSPWLLSDAANVIFKNAKARCYVQIPNAASSGTDQERQEDEDWAIWDEHENGDQHGEKPAWLPKGMKPVLEELPKWPTLALILHEIETDMMLKNSHPRKPIWSLVNVSLLSPLVS